MANKTFQIQYIHPELGVQLAFEVTDTKEKAEEKFKAKHPKYQVLDVRATT